MAWLEFELAYYVVAVQYINNYATETPSSAPKMIYENDSKKLRF